MVSITADARRTQDPARHQTSAIRAWPVVHKIPYPKRRVKTPNICSPVPVQARSEHRPRSPPSPDPPLHGQRDADGNTTARHVFCRRSSAHEVSGCIMRVFVRQTTASWAFVGCTRRLMGSVYRLLPAAFPIQERFVWHVSKKAKQMHESLALDPVILSSDQKSRTIYGGMLHFSQSRSDMLRPSADFRSADSLLGSTEQDLSIQFSYILRL